MRALSHLLRPKSPEGEVYRDPWVQRFELPFAGLGLLIGLSGAVSLSSDGEWLLGVGFFAWSVFIVTGAWWCFFRPHLVVGDDALVLADVFRTRRVAFDEVRSAVAARGSLKLVLIDGEQVSVPGHYLIRYGYGARYSRLAHTINSRVAKSRAAASNDQAGT